MTGSTRTGADCVASPTESNRTIVAVEGTVAQAIQDTAGQAAVGALANRIEEVLAQTQHATSGVALLTGRRAEALRETDRCEAFIAVYGVSPGNLAADVAEQMATATEGVLTVHDISPVDVTPPTGQEAEELATRDIAWCRRQLDDGG